MIRKRLTVLFCDVILMTCLFGPAHAYVKSVVDKPIENVLIEGKVTAELIEVFDPNAALDVEPGQTVTKEAKLTNTGNVTSYLVMKVKYVSGDTNKATGAQLKSEYLTLEDLNRGNNWTLAENGEDYMIYYHNYPVGPGQSTSNLFTGVTLKSDWDEPCNFSIILSGAAIQSTAVTMSNAIAVSLFEE